MLFLIPFCCDDPRHSSCWLYIFFICSQDISWEESAKDGHLCRMRKVEPQGYDQLSSEACMMTHPRSRHCTIKKPAT